MPGAERDTRSLVRLGHKLFFDKRLSSNHKVSCNTCHQVSGQGGAYHQPTAPGANGKPGERNSPTVLNAGFQFAQFWDGRAPDLAAQAKEPMLNPDEMAMSTEAELIARLRGRASYRRKFRAAFPRAAEPVTLNHLAEALAAYERTLTTHDRFDQFLKGKDRALSRAERAGLRLFLTVGCRKCHDGPLLGGNSFQKVGVAHPYSNTNDIGRARITGDPADRFQFKVPSLRNVALTAPYFHDGQVATLNEAVRQMAYLQLDTRLSDDEVRSIVAFLRTLSDRRRSMRPLLH